MVLLRRHPGSAGRRPRGGPGGIRLHHRSNGGGKTTLLRIFLGLLVPQRGTVRILGVSPQEARSRIGYMPQHVSLDTSFPVTAQDVVLMGRMGCGQGLVAARPAGPAGRSGRVGAAGRVGRTPDRRIGELSGGQLQRVFIARALVSAPEALFLDEAMASIDAQSRGEFYEALTELNRTMTIVAVSHDMMILSSHVKSVACVNRDLHYHDSGEITQEMLDAAYHCPVDLVAHGVPHRVLCRHEGK